MLMRLGDLDDCLFQLHAMMTPPPSRVPPLCLQRSNTDSGQAHLTVLPRLDLRYTSLPKPQLDPLSLDRHLDQPQMSTSSPVDNDGSPPSRPARPGMSRSASITGQIKDVWDGFSGGGESGDRPDWMGAFTLLGQF